MASINSNIGALSAQKSMTDQIAKSDQAIERLSTGLRINNAADDAAGSAISSKMEAQVRSLGVAIRNGHDAISMTQTAEGALGEMENILQRVRELAVQAGNSTLSSSDRTAIQEEVTALTSEINSIASSTNFNGVKLLDGTNTSVDFQVGVDATDALTVALESSSASDLGLSSSNGASVYTSGRVTLGTHNSVDVDSIKLNGQDFMSTAVTATTASTLTAAAVIAAQINENTGVHGAVATAFNRVEGGQMGDTFSMAATITITSGGTGEVIAIQSSLDNLIAAINQGVADVTASRDGNAIVLSNTTGNQIQVGVNDVGITAGTYEGMYTLENVDGSATKVELGNLANGYVQEADATVTHLNLFGLNQTSGEGKVKSSAVSDDLIALTDDIRINDVKVGATKLNSAEAKAVAINAISAESGVTANAETELFLDFNFGVSQTNTSFALNGLLVQVADLNSVEDMATEINTQANGEWGVVASATAEGLLRLYDSSGGNITITMTAVTTFVTSATDSDNVATTVAGATTHYGQINLTSVDGGAIKLSDVSTDGHGDGLLKLGLDEQSAFVESGTGGVNVTTLSGATAALTNIDAAIDKLSGFRASFGAVENRIDAKINNMTTLKVNTQAAQSRIEDADFAAETTNMTKAQILTQAATSMLAQANSSKQNLLALLQG
jgi:flagellin